MSDADIRSGEAERQERDAVEAANRVLGETRARQYLRLGGRIAGRLLGALILAAGLFKAVAPQAFAQQILAYNLVTSPALVGIIGFAVIVAECGLGAALLVNYRPRLTLALALGLLAFFLVPVGYAWSTGSTEDCGCMPWTTRTPGEAFVEDLALIAVAAWAWWGQRGASAPTTQLKLALVMLGLAAGMTIPAVAKVAGVEAPGAAGVEGKATFKTLKVEDLQTDLTTGEHLVMLMSTECSHCQAAVPEVNVLFNDKRLPPLVGLAMEGKVDRGLFREDYGAQYPIGQISKSALMSMVPKDFPRLLLVRDGTIVATWEGKLPAPDQVLERK